MPTNSPYCAAKGGLRMLMRTIAVELAPHKILVNNVAPGAVDTPMDDRLKADPKEMSQFLAESPLAGWESRRRSPSSARSLRRPPLTLRCV